MHFNGGLWNVSNVATFQNLGEAHEVNNINQPTVSHNTFEDSVNRLVDRGHTFCPALSEAVLTKARHQTEGLMYKNLSVFSYRNMVYAKNPETDEGIKKKKIRCIQACV